ncbi:uncharacterized protein Bfra_004984 [Botrytis fragariae]|uniref:Uncharacterized protein n=1 Tax=Botrytis fragariae TaxID=1964551 RepID=A0A8H6ATW3_9HELO|nr:uncharacterized protein Bfra_004984 [Botrytis fragariae]KAF5873522.1 hypothetical protein Bfra_004984 [Botrytis fragariae]
MQNGFRTLTMSTLLVRVPRTKSTAFEIPLRINDLVFLHTTLRKFHQILCPDSRVFHFRINDVTELAFQTTVADNEAVEPPESPDPIHSAVTINSTFADRDAKTVSQAQLQEDTRLSEIINIQNTELCTGISDQAAIANQDTMQEEMALDRLAMVDQDFKLDWEHARVNKESDHVSFLRGSELVSAEIWRTIKKTGAGYLFPDQLLLVCRESHDSFLEHYSIMNLQSLPGNEVILDGTINSRHSTFHASSRRYIDNKSDTLVIRNLQDIMEDLLLFNMHLNLYVNQGELDLSPLSINCLQPINADTIDSLVECIENGHYHEDLGGFVRNPSHGGQSALNHSMIYKSQYLERIQNNPDYWGGIEFETSFLINFHPDYDFYIINRDSRNQKDPGVYKDGIFYDSYGGKEQHGEYESTTRFELIDGHGMIQERFKIWSNATRKGMGTVK